MIKESLSVYSPSDPLESAVQRAAHEISGEWLPSYECQLMSKSIESLKCFDNWSSQDNLLPLRTKYFFHDTMTLHKEKMVFVTTVLYLRDILENRLINYPLHNPIVFMTLPLAKYIFSEYPVHIHIDMNILKHNNSKSVKFNEIGGFTIVDDSDVVIDSNVVLNIIINDHGYKRLVDNIIGNTFFHIKKASSDRDDTGVFSVGVSDRDIMINQKVFDKIKRQYAVVKEVNPTDYGVIVVEYNDKTTDSIDKQHFDLRYTRC